MVTGEYGDETDADNATFAACALYQATGQSYYLSDAAALYQGGRSADFGWANMGGYGNAVLYFGARACEDDFLAGRSRADARNRGAYRRAHGKQPAWHLDYRVSLGQQYVICSTTR